MSSSTLSTNHPEILAFYEKHASLDFETMNLVLIEILGKVIHSMDTSLNNNLASQLLQQFSLLQHKVDSLSGVFDSRLTEYRKEYMSDLKLILNSHNAEQMVPLLRESTSSLLDKTSLLMNEFLPKNNESLTKHFQYLFQELQTSLTQQTSQLLASTLDKKGIEDFLQQVQQQIAQSNSSLLTLVSSSETRVGQRFGETDKKMDEIKTLLRENDIAPLQKSVGDVLRKFEYGIGKGTMSEHLLYNTLVQHYPTAEIEYVADKKETGDILFQQHDGPTILIENKDHQSANVPRHEVEKFIRDCHTQECCGILLAQHRGIANKGNYEIQIHDGHVLLYLHEVHFDIDKIRMAIDIVENLQKKLDEIAGPTTHDTIDKDTLEVINREYVYFVNQKTSLLKLSRETTDRLVEKINELKFPNLDHYLSQRFASASTQKDLVCSFCNEPVRKSMLQHLRYCQAKRDHDLKSTATATTMATTVAETVATEASVPRTKRAYRKKDPNRFVLDLGDLYETPAETENK